mgnify:CR=1 FL=1
MLDISDSKFPVVVFSHGVAGNRSLYSLICTELASQGYVVLALEHADGTASVAKVAGGARKYLYYQGLGNEEGQVEKTRYRIQEMKTSYKILRAMHHKMTLSERVQAARTCPQRQAFIKRVGNHSSARTVVM